MEKYYQDYFWKNGKPYGRAVAKLKSSDEVLYKIVADPYYKRISVEKYQNNVFHSLIYDSAIFDFRKLKELEQLAWQKNTVEESGDLVKCNIRDQDDRLILIEEYFFVGQKCQRCQTFSPHGNLLCTQKIIYESMGDPFNGVILYDCNEHMIMWKRYSLESGCFEFGTLIEECTDLTLNQLVAK